MTAQAILMEASIKTQCDTVRGYTMQSLSINKNMQPHFYFCGMFSTRCFLEGRTFVILCL